MANARQTVWVGLDELFSAMRRHPDVEAPNLVAVDGADRLILDLAAAAIEQVGDGRVAVIDDAYGALTLGAATVHGLRGIRVHQDSCVAEQALARNASEVGLEESYQSLGLGPQLLSGVGAVLLRMPKSLAALAEIADAVARHADSDVTVFAGGRDKHLSHAMNDTLARSFRSVRASLGRFKSRVLVASESAPAADPPYPVRTQIELPEAAGGPLELVAHGAVFSGAKLDIGTRFLLEQLPKLPDVSSVVDLGCGSGIIAAALARARPAVTIVATDASTAAVASAEATAAANGVAGRVTVVRDDAMASFPDAACDLIVCNPPFHLGSAVHTGAAAKMFRAAGRVLRPGGQMWTVYNGHLDYRHLLGRAVGPTDVVARSRKFVVSRSRRLSL
jgi:16S rRNA (guanine1207-N2)-methyltransferase